MNVISTNPITGEQRTTDIVETSVESLDHVCSLAALAAAELATRPLSWLSLIHI